MKPPVVGNLPPAPTVSPALSASPLPPPPVTPPVKGEVGDSVVGVGT